MPYVALAHAGRIHYAERGERRPDRPSVVFIHGAGASSAIWSMVLARVARTSHAIAIDLPGHGPSALGAPAALSLERYRDAVGELCGALCLGPSVLVGHSLGGLVALEAALAWPDKVRALLLVAAAPKMPVDPELLALLRDDPEGATAWLADHALSPHAKPALRRGFLAAGTAASPREVTRADFEIVRATDLTGRVAAIGCQITWVDGADDRIVPRADRPGAIVTVTGAGHLLPIEAPAAIADAYSGRSAQ
ncbi:MAG TPA: alpha/beta hydrolase [Polyangia bacterium]|jgi:pimeloyl-ACP methyl ester carboxylesterase|nr:alpha/beta hydrolase [Polyangia bacterium]